MTPSALDETSFVAVRSSEGVVHSISVQNLMRIAGDGVIELYFDEASGGIAVHETLSNKFWYSLPVETDSATDDANVLNVEAYSNGTYFSLNSQDDSLALGGMSHTMFSENRVQTGITVSYTFAANLDGSAATLDACDVSFTLNVNYRLSDGNLITEINCAELNNTNNFSILSISFLEYFGATTGQSQDGFLLLPYGSGTTVDLSVAPDDEENISLNVYGDNLSVYQSDSAYSASYPIFGEKLGESAFVAIIQNGDALSSIHMSRSPTTTYNKIYPSFNITDNTTREIYDSSTKDSKTVDYLADSPYAGQIQICYRFLSKSNAGLGGMSISCREQLIRANILSTKTVEPSEYLPCNISVIGSVEKYINAFSILTISDMPLTTFEEALDLSIQLKAKGLNNFNLRYIGILDGGTNQKSIASAGLNPALGGVGSLNELCVYLDSLKLTLYADVDVLSSTSTLRSSSSSAQSICSVNAAYLDDNPYCDTESYIPEQYSKLLLSPSSLSDVTEKFLSRSFLNNVKGISINDASRILYSDFQSTYVDRQAAKELVVEGCVPLSTNRKLMVSDANMYMFKQADYIIDLNSYDASKEFGDDFSSVPFIEMVLHGTVQYSLDPINTSSNYQVAALRSVEYGAIPSYEWTYKSGSSSLSQKYYYANWINSAYTFYQKVNTALSDLSSVRITNNYSPIDNVKCTEYENGALIYVNYSLNEKTVDGVTIPAMDFVRI